MGKEIVLRVWTETPAGWTSFFDSLCETADEAQETAQFYCAHPGAGATDRVVEILIDGVLVNKVRRLPA